MDLSSGDKVLTSKIALGSAQFGLDYGISNRSGRVPLDEVKEIVEVASLFGIDTIDTAYAYGASESVLGQVNVDGWKVITKLPSKEHRDSQISSYLNESLERLNIERLYGYLIHDIEDLFQDEGLWNELNSLKTKNIVKKIGVSVYTPEDIKKLMSNGISPDIVQVPFNILDNRFGSLCEELSKEGCETHSRSTFLQGLFFLPIEGLNSFFDPIKPFLELLHRFYPNESERAGALLKLVLQKDYIDKTIIGVENKKQLVQNVEWVNEVELRSEVVDWPKNNQFNRSIVLPTNWP